MKQVTTNVGRFIFGNLYTPQTKDYDGNPCEPFYTIGLAVAKQPGETHWNQTALGAVIWNEGLTFPNNAAARPDFAWKVHDGDSQIPNKKNKRPCDDANQRGHWIFKFSSQFAPQVYNANGTQLLAEKDFVKPGDFIQIAGTIKLNGNDKNPGVYLNYQLVAHAAYGERIVNGPDAATVGFGVGVTLPLGASALPVGALPTQGAVPAPAAAPAPVAASAPIAALAPVPVVPATGFLSPPVGQAAPAPAPPAPAPVGPAMTAKANGTPYAAFIAQGWTDATLRANGYMA